MEWWVFTERRRERERHGFGQESLDQTLEHLRSRGDRTATVDVRQRGEDAPSRSTISLAVRR